jgi:serine/threonine protein kinase
MPTPTLEPVARAICSANKYSLEKRLGEGAFKEVFLITTPGGQEKALKILKPGLASERTAREVEAMTRCRHANIASLETVAFFHHSTLQYTYLVEEFVGGGTLDDRLRKENISRDALIPMGAALIDAIGHVASNDLVHRDIKPANILFRTADEPVLVDFGLVRDLRKSSVTVTWATCGPCTPLYASPEQLTNDKAIIGWRSDQFSLGVVLAFAALGIHPFARLGDDPAQTVLRVEAREGPSTEFTDAARSAGLPVLVRMVGNWPVERFRKPADLLTAWQGQGGS